MNQYLKKLLERKAVLHFLNQFAKQGRINDIKEFDYRIFFSNFHIWDKRQINRGEKQVETSEQRDWVTWKRKCEKNTGKNISQGQKETSSFNLLHIARTASCIEK